MSDKVCDHSSVGMIVRQDDKILLIERRKPPFGFAAPAGHVDSDPDYDISARRELEEEVGLKAGELKLVLDKDVNNSCRRVDGSWHHWKVYEVEATGDLRPSKDETKRAGWYGPADIKELITKTREYRAGSIAEEAWQTNPGLEPVWYDFFEELGIIAKVQ